MLDTVSQDKVIDFTNIKYNVIIPDTLRIFSTILYFCSIAFVSLAFYTLIIPLCSSLIQCWTLEISLDDFTDSHVTHLAASNWIYVSQSSEPYEGLATV